MAKVKIRRTPTQWVRATTRGGWVVWVPSQFQDTPITADHVKEFSIPVQVRGTERTAVILHAGKFTIIDHATGQYISHVARGRWADTHGTFISALREAARFVVTAHMKEEVSE